MDFFRSLRVDGTQSAGLTCHPIVPAEKKDSIVKRLLSMHIVACCCAFLPMSEVFARGFGGGGGGGFHGGGGGSAAPHYGGGASAGAYGGGRQSFTTRSPSYSSPGSNGSSGFAGRTNAGAAATAHPGFTYRQSTNPTARTNAAAGANRATLGTNAAVGANRATVGANRAGVGTNANVGNRAGLAGGVNRSGVNNAAATRNQVNVGNRTVNLANSNYRPSYAAHAGLYHGYWGGYGGYGGFGRGFGYGPFGYGGFGYGFGSGLGFGLGMGLGYGLLGGMFSPMGWGMGGWGMGSMGYGSGYLGYNNPYCGGGGGGCGGYGSGGYGGGYSYAQPIPVNYNSASPASGAGSPADDLLNAAIAAFKQGDYDSALDITNKAVAQFPTDAVLHEFRATVLFAKGDYQQSAAVLHSLLAVGPGWDWTTMSKLYPDIAVYTSQLRALESAVRARPDDPAGHFVLAYQYMTAGHNDAAAGQLDKVTQLVSNDKVAADLLRMIRPPANAVPGGTTGPGPVPHPPTDSVGTPGPAANPNQTAVPSGPPIDPQILIGSWNASREDGSQFHLTLGKDQTFHWTFSAPKQAPKELDGKYTVDHNVLALEQTGGGALIGQVSPHGDDKFNFKMLGTPPEDKGLDFTH